MKVMLLAFCGLFPCLAANPAVDAGKILGRPNAPVVLEVYSDFECPACKMFHEQMLPRLIKDYVETGRLAVISHEFPLNIAAHKYSREAAGYATAAARLEIYQPVADVLFRNQANWEATGRVWETVATVLSPEQQKKIQALMKDPSIAQEVQHDIDQGARERVNSTPSLFITRPQRMPLPWPVRYELLQSLLNGLK